MLPVRMHIEESWKSWTESYEQTMIPQQWTKRSGRLEHGMELKCNNQEHKIPRQ